MKERPDLKRCPFCKTVMMQAVAFVEYGRDFQNIGCPECDYWFSEHEAKDRGMTLDEYANRRATT